VEPPPDFWGYCRFHDIMIHTRSDAPTPFACQHPSPRLSWRTLLPRVLVELQMKWTASANTLADSQLQDVRPVRAWITNDAGEFIREFRQLQIDRTSSPAKATDMDVQPRDPAEEIKRLQRCTDELISVTTRPNVWKSDEPSRIVDTLLDELLRMLQLDFVYIHLKKTGDQAPIEVVRFAQSQEKIAPPSVIGDALKHWLATAPQERPPLLRLPLGARDFSVVPLGLGMQGEFGVIAAGSERADFPQQTEKLVLSVTVNQAALALVAHQTAELAASNEELQQQVTDRKHAGEDLRTSQEKHRVIIEAANDAVISMDERGDIRLANPATQRIFGYDPVELIGKPMTVLMPEVMRKLHENGFKRYLATGKRHLNWQGVEVTAQRKDGVEFPAEVSFGEFTSAGHKVFTGFIRDISERKQAEEMRAAHARQIAVRADVSMAFGKEESLKKILNECSEAVVRHLDAAFVRIWTLNDDGKMLQLQASAGMYTHLDGPHSRIPMGEFKIGRIAQQRKPHLTNHVLNDPRISDTAWAKKEGMVSFAGYPLCVGDRTIGVLAMFSRKPVSPETTETLASGADLIAQGIERKHAEDKLRDSERSLRQLTETIPQMLWSAQADGTVDYCNRRVLDYTGLAAEQVHRAGWMNAVHPEDIESMAQAWRLAVSTGEPFQYEFRFLRSADQAYRWCVSSALPLQDHEGRVIKWFGSVVDLHDWKEAQHALQMTRMELTRVSRLTTMGELAASIAHEVNQPLTAVINNSSACLRLLANRGLEPDVLHRALEEIINDGTRASAVLARIRAFIKKEAAEKNPLDINEVIQEVLVLAGHELYENQIAIDRQLTARLPFVLADRVQMQQVLLNLIMNGIEALIAVTDRARFLRVQSRIDETGDVLVAVSDTGTGFDVEVDRVFTPFFTTKATGMGMGLPISRTIVEGHGGRLWAAPNSPHGAVISFTLPATAGSLS
jgi:PAS domain S-box-containing protein